MGGSLSRIVVSFIHGYTNSLKYGKNCDKIYMGAFPRLCGTAVEQGGQHVTRRILTVMVVMILAIFLNSCGNKGRQPTQRGKVLNNPEVKLEYYGNPENIILPNVPEVRWDFFEEKGKTDLTCKLKLKVVFKCDGKYNAKIQFLDLNKFPVTSEQIKLIGKKGEETTYEKTLYIAPRDTGRITKAQILMTPLH